MRPAAPDAAGPGAGVIGIYVAPKAETLTFLSADCGVRIHLAPT